MKIIKPLVSILIYSILASCQDDINIDTSNNDTNNSDSVFTSQVRRTSMFDGSFDDILDASPCFAINYPINIILNSANTTLTSVTDLSLITANDNITFSFPITITNYDYSEIVIGSQEEYDALTNACDNLIESNNTPLNCIDFNYPITLYTATNSQTQNTLTVITDQELYFFIDNLDSSTLYSFNYPIEITETSTISIDNDTALEGYLTDCID